MRQCVHAIITNEEGKILLQKHKKLKRYTIPGGKVESKETLRDAMVRELKEELDISANMSENILFVKIHKAEYPADSGIMREFEENFFEVLSYDGHIINKEPEKHEELIWMKPEEIRSSGLPISIVLDFYLKNSWL